MKKRFVVCSLLIIAITACEGKPFSTREKTETPVVPKVVVEREKAEKEQPLPPEVKIKLRRDGKENYSWEISGSDVDQILKVNGKLRKELGAEQPR